MNFRIVFNAAFFFVVLLLFGCSYSFVDSQGARRIIGLVDIRVDEKEGVIETIEVTTVGTSFLSTPMASGLSLGYTREKLMALPVDCYYMPKQDNRQ